jgi:hypothetical protein
MYVVVHQLEEMKHLLVVAMMVLMWPRQQAQMRNPHRMNPAQLIQAHVRAQERSLSGRQPRTPLRPTATPEEAACHQVKGSGPKLALGAAACRRSPGAEKISQGPPLQMHCARIPGKIGAAPRGDQRGKLRRDRL